jgi:tetratricopeptide (TPR) repeat protein
MKTKVALLKAFFLYAVLQPAAAWGACELSRVEFPVTMSGPRPLVTARINDTDLNFIIDSGAFYSLMTPALAQQLKLHLRRGPYGMRMEGIGGSVDVYVTRVERFALQKSEFSNVEFIVGGNELGADAVGLLGQNFLGGADVEYDLANGMMRIVNPSKDCRDAFLAYWAGSQPVVEIELEPQRTERVSATIGTAYINAVKVRVKFDTGASVSVLSLRAAKRAGLMPGGAGVVPAGPMHGIGRREVRTWIAPVKTFTLGTERISDTHLRFGDVDLVDTDMLIGTDYFLSHRIYVANSQGKLYFTYNGGPAFNLSTSSAPLRPVSGSENAAAAPTDELSTPTDAAGYARRGAAFASRREFDRAIGDLTRACELDPGVAKYFLQRGQVQLRLGQRSLAMSDFDQALRLKPDDAEARLARARLHAFGGDPDSARADLIAADKAVASQADARWEIGELYMRLHQPDAALIQFDRWIASHEEDVNVARVRNSRCWARALLASELDKALEDCRAAVKSKPEHAPYLDSRGLVYLRLGRLDKALADYDAALRLDPKLAWSLYGRGLVRLRTGATEAGNADLAAAAAIDPSIGDEARRYGIAP